jgi:hypothetical protein
VKRIGHSHIVISLSAGLHRAHYKGNASPSKENILQKDEEKALQRKQDPLKSVP